MSAEQRILSGRPAGWEPWAGRTRSPQEQEAGLLRRHRRRSGLELGWGLALEGRRGAQTDRWQGCPTCLGQVPLQTGASLGLAALTSEAHTALGHSGPTSESQPTSGVIPPGSSRPQVVRPCKVPNIAGVMNTAVKMVHLGSQLFWGSPTVTCLGLCLHSPHCPRQRDETPHWPHGVGRGTCPLWSGLVTEGVREGTQGSLS